MKQVCFILLFFLLAHNCSAQPTPFFLKGALKENREQLHRNIISNTILKNLSLPLSDSTEENWQDAFWGMELIGYKTAWTENKIHAAFTGIENRSTAFQQSLLELIYTNYHDIFTTQVRSLLQQVTDVKVFAMCAVYLLSAGQKDISLVQAKTKERIALDPNNPILQQLIFQVQQQNLRTVGFPSFKNLFSDHFLAGNVLIISIQRRNRNYPGLVIVRDSSGHFIKDGEQVFAVPQLARSINNLPGFLTNGNTPEGIFRMDGFDTSAINFIGPTTNIQLTMPFEYKASHFFKDSTITDSTWNVEKYTSLLPADLRDYYPLYQSYYAGKAGRTEIIAHGTTVDPSYYKTASYYPLTPTQGCLCTKEIWNDENGRLKESDQQKLTDAVIKAGGPNGYAIVINIDDQQQPVTQKEIEDLLKQ